VIEKTGQRISEDRIVNLVPRGVVKLSNGADKNAGNESYWGY